MKSALLDNIREDHAIGVAYSKNIKRFRKKGPNVAFVECHQRSIIKKAHVGQPSYPWPLIRLAPEPDFWTSFSSYSLKVAEKQVDKSDKNKSI